MTDESPINAALRHFDATEANVEKLERMFKEMRKLIPDGICFGGNAQYDDFCRTFADVLAALPKIDGWKPSCHLQDLNEIAQNRLDAMEIDEISAKVSVEESIEEPARELAAYRHRLFKKRRELTRGAILETMGRVDEALRQLRLNFPKSEDGVQSVEGELWDSLKDLIKEVETLLGSASPRPSRWSYLHRHLAFGQLCDLDDIEVHDWPEARAALSQGIYDQNEPIPVNVDDIGLLASRHPKGRVATRLNWKGLSAEDYERLVFGLISAAQGYENPSWLMKTNAPDRGRDLSVFRVVNDSLGGVIRSRIIIQCRNKPEDSVNVRDVAELKEQMSQWEPPRVDVLIIATTGRFTSDAVALIEKQNNGDRGLRIEMWPESHLERLLAERPALIAEYKLR